MVDPDLRRGSKRLWNIAFGQLDLSWLVNAEKEEKEKKRKEKHAKNKIRKKKKHEPVNSMATSTGVFLR